MANKIVLKKSSVSSKVPLATDLDYGELALNYTDEKLYFKNASNVIKSLNVTQSILTIGTGLSGTSYNGTSAVTIAINSTVATLTGTQTLTNKTIAAGSNTISGLTNANLSGTAGITNANLANSSVTIGSTAIALGASATTIAGLTSVTSTGFTGALTGNASTATTLATGRTIAITGDLTYTSGSFNGSANVTGTGTLATVNSNVGSFTNASLTVNAKGLVTAASSGTAPVTSVTGTAPIVSSGGVTPAISISAATTSAAGSMSSADKTKLDGIATNATANTGTVTSVGGTGTVSGLTLTGTVTTTGNLTLGGTLSVAASNFASQTANTVLAAPNGSNGVPTFRTLVAADIPTLNQNTTGSAATLTTTRTLWGQNFNGSANVTGALSSVTTLSMSGQLTNTIATGTAPLAITSTTRVANLNVATAGTADTLTTARTINTVSFNGSANIVVEPYVENDDSTNATRYITFVDSSTAGHQRLNEDSNFTINPSTGTVTTNGAFASTFALNKNTIDVSYSIPSGYNAVAAGPVVINNGITVTIPTGSTWVIV
jgi:hypothetical protein